MKLLGIDSSGNVAGVAVLENDILTAEFTANYKKTHSQTLLPMLDEVKKLIELDLHSLDAIAVSAGPGSFTGLRIGSATAKGLGLALNLPIVSVPTVDALAMNLVGTDAIVCPMMDARRGQVYTGIYRFTEEVIGEAGEQGAVCKESRLQVVKEQCAVAVEEILEALNQLELPGDVIFLGDGTPMAEPIIAKQLRRPYRFAPAALNRQRAASIALLGAEYLKAGKAQPAEEHAPEYLRPSQAERVRVEQEKGTC